MLTHKPLCLMTGRCYCLNVAVGSTRRSTIWVNWRLTDLKSLTRTTIPIVNLPLPPVPHNSFSSITFSTSQDSESDSSSSTDSSVELTDTNRCHARLAPLYNFPPLPPQPPLLQHEPEQKVDPSKEYQSGVMMAAEDQGQSLQGGVQAIFLCLPQSNLFAGTQAYPWADRRH